VVEEEFLYGFEQGFVHHLPVAMSFDVDLVDFELAADRCHSVSSRPGWPNCFTTAAGM